MPTITIKERFERLKIKSDVIIQKETKRLDRVRKHELSLKKLKSETYQPTAKINLIAQQNAKCAVCEEIININTCTIHKAGSIPAVLCFRCSNGLRQFKNSITLLHCAIDYLNVHL